MKQIDFKKIFFSLGLITLISVYRYFWSLTPSWQVVGVSTLYVADFYNLFEAKVGLLSSKNIPMPNGMLLLAYLVKPLNNLIIISFVISMIQTFFIFLLVKELNLNRNEKFFIFLALSTSTYISNISVHFLNQWIVINFSIVFFYLYLKFERNKNLNTLAFLYIVAVIPPTIYLGSIVTSIFTVPATLHLTLKNINLIKKNKQKVIKNGIIVFIFYLFFLIFTWIPYFRTVDLTIFNNLNINGQSKLNLLIRNSLLFPFFFLDVFTEEISFNIRFLESAVITDSLQLLKVFYIKVHEVIIVYLFFLTIIMIKNKKFDLFKRTEIILFFIFIYIFTVFTPIIGGNNFYDFIRMDQYSEMYIYYLLVFFIFLSSFDKRKYENVKKTKNEYILNFSIVLVFFLVLNYFSRFYRNEGSYFLISKLDLLSVPTYGFLLLSIIFIFYEYNFYKYHKYIKFIILTVFILTNIAFSYQAIKERINPPYYELTEEEVPIYIKYKVVDFMVPIILESGTLSPSISYQLGGGKFEWIDQHGSDLNKWFPISAYTIGRTFDYIFLKEWGINNKYEGGQERFFDNSDYIISFTKDRLVSEEDGMFSTYIFGPLRVAIKK